MLNTVEKHFMPGFLFKLRKARPSVASPKKLADVAVGTRVRIVGFASSDGTEPLRERGMCEDAVVRVLSAGNPLICLVWGSRLMLTRSLAENILIEVI